MKEYLSDVSKVYSELKSGENGISSAEASARLEKNGANKLVEAKRDGIIKRFFKQLCDPMTLILLAAALISGIMAVYADESFADVIIILAVVIINAILGVFQESKAEKAIAALQEMTAATSKVIRDGVQIFVKTEDLVVGDVIVLEAGDAVPADARITFSSSMKVEEAALTGESVAVSKHSDVLEAENGKDVPLGDRKNMVYMGSTVVYGRGRAVVTATGMETEMGKIATALSSAIDGDTPLQKKLDQLSKILSFLVIGICVIIFGVNLLRDGTGKLLDTFMVAVSLAVAAIPEGLATVVTIVLSMGVTKMSKRNAVIRKLTAVETLGCAQIICSDKTGTLTQNKMTVVDYRGSDEKLLATAMALCSDAVLNSETNAEGEPTECALVNYAYKLGLHKGETEKTLPRVGEAPFDSMRKMMSTVHADGNAFIQFTKGAPDVVLSRCSTALVDGKEVPMTEEIKKQILAENKAMADKALRVLCAAKRSHSSKPASFEPEALETDLCYVGLTGMIDPVRPEVKDAIVECKSAGIRPIMITGDHKDTAVAIALELGIISSAAEAITGAELDEISDKDFESKIETFSVYARVQPEHKVRIVNAWRAKGKIAAMTGDGVNDAPSIKSADIGVGMGITGTDVTKNVADMVLADDNFATIVSAVEEGRRIYDNIRKAIQFLLSSNLSEVVAIFVATLMGFTILHPVHLLWINLITDCFPALSLGMEKADKDVMKQPPRDSNDGIFAGGMGVDIAIQGLVVALITLAAYFIGAGYSFSAAEELASKGTTMAFIALSSAEVFHSFNMRSRRQSIFTLKKQNAFLWGAGLLSLVCTVAVVFIPPLRSAFKFTAISLADFGIAVAIAFAIVPVVEITKFIQRKLKK